MSPSTSESGVVDNAKRSNWCERVKLVRKVRSEGGTRVGLAQPIPNYSEAYINPAGKLPCAGTSTKESGPKRVL